NLEPRADDHRDVRAVRAAAMVLASTITPGCQWPSRSPRWWPAEVPILRLVGSAPLRSGARRRGGRQGRIPGRPGTESEVWKLWEPRRGGASGCRDRPIAAQGPWRPPARVFASFIRNDPPAVTTTVALVEQAVEQGDRGRVLGQEAAPLFERPVA